MIEHPGLEETKIKHPDIQELKEAKQWAYNRVHGETFLILDTETTGLGDAEIVDICVMSRYGQPLLNTLVKPTISISESSTRIHKITDEMVLNAPTFPDIYPKLKKLLEGKIVVIYNASFDFNILKNCCQLHGLEPIKIYTECAMLWYAKFVGDWNDYYGNYKWQKLPGGGEHRALSDCKATYQLLLHMAEIDYLSLRPHTPYRLFPPVQIGVEWNPGVLIEIRRRTKAGWRFAHKITIKFPKLHLLIADGHKFKKEDFSFAKFFHAVTGRNLSAKSAGTNLSPGELCANSTMSNTRCGDLCVKTEIQENVDVDDISF